MLIPINLTGGDYQHKSRPLSNQVTRNFWPQVQANPKTKSPYVLNAFYGLKPWASPAITGRNRGELENQGLFYKVTGTKLYRVSSNGTHTELGTIPGSNRCIMWAMGAQIIVVNGSGSAYIWDGTTLTKNESPNIEFPRSVSVLNSQALYDDGTGQGWRVSDVGQPLVINGLNNASAESESDELIRTYAFKDTAYFMGSKTIEPWYNSGQGNPPFDKIQGGIISIGLGALNSVAHDDDFIYLFGSDKQVHTLTGGVSSIDTVISTPAMAKQFQDYAVTSDAIGWTMKLEGQPFYCLTFPVQNVTWVYPKGGEWFQWGTGLTGRIRADGYVNVFGKHLVSDYQSGNIYELDAQTHTDAGQPIVRVRDSAPIHGGLLKADGKEFEINSLEIILETGVGLTAGQGVDPRIGISVSRNGGKSFGTERFLKCGTLGQIVTVKTGPWGRFKECVIRVRCSDPIYWCIYSAAVEMELCI